MEGGEETSMQRGQLTQRLRWAGAWLMDTALLAGADKGCTGSCIRSRASGVQSP